MLASADLWEKAKTLIPNGTMTLSKCPDRYVDGVYPKLLVSGDGCEVLTHEGKTLTDFICSLGAVSLGFRHHAVDRAVVETILSGQVLLSLPHKKEAQLAELLTATYMPGQVKYFKTGSDVLSAAVKVARACTGKMGIATCGYHGWHDWYTVLNDKRAGIPPILGEYVRKFTYNDPQSLEDILRSGGIAAVVMEPVVYDGPKDGFLDKVRALCDKYGALFILDEVVTGYRFGLGGAAALFGVKPDLACLSKGLGNGYPIGALIGDKEYMSVFERDDFFVSGTYGGDLVGISAAIAVINFIRETNAAGAIWENGQNLKREFNRLAKDLDIPVACKGFAPRTFFDFPSSAHKALFWQECIRRRVLFGYANFISASHTKEAISKALQASWDALAVLKKHWSDPKAALEGNVPVEVFRLR